MCRPRPMPRLRTRGARTTSSPPSCALRPGSVRSARVSQARPGQLHCRRAHKGSRGRFLQANWGYDENRMWQVQAILKTPVDGVSKVIVLVGDKTGKAETAGSLFLCSSRRQAHHHRRRDHQLRRAPLRRRPPAAAAARRRPLSRVGIERSGIGRVCRFPVPALQRGAGQHGQAGRRIIPRRALSFRTFPSRPSIQNR